MFIMKVTMLAMLLSVSLLIMPCMGFQQASKVHGNGNDLIQFRLSPNKAPLNSVMHSILKTMNEVEKLPSCQKSAAQSLLNACSEIDHASSMATGEGIDVMLEASKSVYAARLAICELGDADLSIPGTCAHLKPMDAAQKHDGLRFVIYNTFGKSNPHKTQNDQAGLQQCLSSLSSNPIMWTSYSNARQNAVMMCHSMRAALDKDDQLKTNKIVSNVIMEAMSVMTDTTENLQVVLNQWNEMRGGMKAFHLALNSDMEMQNRISQQWAQLELNIQSLGRDASKVREMSGEMTSELENYHIRTQAVQADVSQALNQALLAFIRLNQTQNSILAISDEVRASVALSGEHTGMISDQHQIMLHITNAIVKNLTDAARTVSEVQKDISNLPTNIIQWTTQSAYQLLPFGLLACVDFVLFSSLCFALLDKWGFFGRCGSVVASFSIGTATTYFVLTIRTIPAMPDTSTFGMTAFVLTAVVSCIVWYKRQTSSNQRTYSTEVDEKVRSCSNDFILP